VAAQGAAVLAAQRAAAEGTATAEAAEDAAAAAAAENRVPAQARAAWTSTLTEDRAAATTMSAAHRLSAAAAASAAKPRATFRQLEGQHADADATAGGVGGNRGNHSSGMLRRRFYDQSQPGGRGEAAAAGRTATAAAMHAATGAFASTQSLSASVDTAPTADTFASRRRATEPCRIAPSSSAVSGDGDHGHFQRPPRLILYPDGSTKEIGGLAIASTRGGATPPRHGMSAAGSGPGPSSLGGGGGGGGVGEHMASFDFCTNANGAGAGTAGSGGALHAAAHGQPPPPMATMMEAQHQHRHQHHIQQQHHLHHQNHSNSHSHGGSQGGSHGGAVQLETRVWCLPARNKTSLLCFTCRLCVRLCELTTCYSNAGACFQRVRLQCDVLLSNFAFKFNLRRYLTAPSAVLTAPSAAATPAAAAAAARTCSPTRSR